VLVASEAVAVADAAVVALAVAVSVASGVPSDPELHATRNTAATAARLTKILIR
jgi:hypothetical protein